MALDCLGALFNALDDVVAGRYETGGAAGVVFDGARIFN